MQDTFRSKSICSDEAEVVQICRPITKVREYSIWQYHTGYTYFAAPLFATRIRLKVPDDMSDASSAVLFFSVLLEMVSWRMGLPQPMQDFGFIGFIEVSLNAPYPGGKDYLGNIKMNSLSKYSRYC